MAWGREWPLSGREPAWPFPSRRCSKPRLLLWGGPRGLPSRHPRDPALKCRLGAGRAAPGRGFQAGMGRNRVPHKKLCSEFPHAREVGVKQGRGGRGRIKPLPRPLGLRRCWEPGFRAGRTVEVRGSLQAG